MTHTTRTGQSQIDKEVGRERGGRGGHGKDELEEVGREDLKGGEEVELEEELAKGLRYKQMKEGKGERKRGGRDCTSAPCCSN